MKNEALKKREMNKFSEEIYSLFNWRKILLKHDRVRSFLGTSQVSYFVLFEILDS